MTLTPDALLTTTRTVRRRLDLQRPVSRETVVECLDVALQAPNGHNTQTWDWLIVDDPAMRADIAEIYRRSMDDFVDRLTADATTTELARLGFPFALASAGGARIQRSGEHLRDHLHEIPVHVIPTVRGRLERATSFEQATIWGSIIPAVWSLLLALRSRGMGGAWTTMHLRYEREMADLLGIPYGDVTQAGLFPIAYTLGTEFKPAFRSATESVVHWNGW